MTKIEKMCREHFNEPVLMVFDLARLIGYGEDADDCYLIVKYPDRGVVWHTAVGGYVFLDRLRIAGDWDDFKRLDEALELNNVPKKSKKFALKFAQRKQCLV